MDKDKLEEALREALRLHDDGLLMSSEREWIRGMVVKEFFKLLAPTEDEQVYNKPGSIFDGCPMPIAEDETSEDNSEISPEWMEDMGFCGTCAYFHREPRCQGGLCGFYPDTPQVAIGFGCEEYSIDKEWVMHFAIQGKI